MIIELKVTAGAKSSGFKRENGIYYLRINAKAIDGKANKAIIDFLSNLLKIKKRDVEIIKGERSGKKLLKLNLDEEYLNTFFEENKQ